MNQGIVAIESFPNINGGPIWDWSTAIGVIPILYANTMLKQKVGERDEIFSDTFVRAAGQIRPLLPYRDDYTEEYGRFHPRNRSDFTYMCDRCMGSWPALIAPSTVSDEAALRTFESFNRLSEQITLKGIQDEPIAELVKTASVEIPWCYFVCLTIKRAFTVFASQDSAIVNDFEIFARSFGDVYRIRERW